MKIFTPTLTQLEKAKDDLKIRKQKSQYFIECKVCNVEGLYHDVENLRR